MFCKEHPLTVTSSLTRRIQTNQIMINFHWPILGKKINVLDQVSNYFGRDVSSQVAILAG